MYRNYHSKGKGSPLHLPPRLEIIGEYLGKDLSWRKYKAYANLLRRYRNVVVHDHLIGLVPTQLGSSLVPKKEKIQDYRSFFAIERATTDLEKLNSDFI